MTPFNEKLLSGDLQGLHEALDLFQIADEAERQSLLSSLTAQGAERVFGALMALPPTVTTHRGGYEIPPDDYAQAAQALMTGYEDRWCALTAAADGPIDFVSLRVLLQSQSAERHQRGCWILRELAPRIDGCMESSSMETLFLNSSPTTDLSFLPSLPLLRWLVLDQVAVEDLRPVGSLPSLERLSLRNSAATDLSCLTALSCLKALTLDGAKGFRDLSALSSLHQLEDLDLRGVGADDLTGLPPLPRITRLRAGSPGTSLDLSFLEGMDSLESLELVGDGFTGVEALSRLKALRHLTLVGARVTDTASLEKLTALQTLRLSKCTLSALDVSGLTALERLDLVQTGDEDDTSLQDRDGRLKLVGTLPPSIRVLAIDALDVVPDDMARDIEERGREAYVGELINEIPAFSLVLSCNWPPE